MKKKGKTGAKARRKLSPKALIFCLTLVFLGLFFTSRVFLNSKTLEMSNTERKLTDNISAVQDEVDQLQEDIQHLESRSTMLGKVDTGIRDIPDNVVIVDQN